MTERDINYEEEVKRLLHEVERPPGESIPPGASPAEIVTLEATIGISLPPLLRKWLSTSNGPFVGPGGIAGINPKREDRDIPWLLELFPSWKSNRWIPIAGDGCGDYYVVSTQNEFGDGEPVLFIDVHDGDDSRPTFIAASNVWRFLRFLLLKDLRKSKWPFDEIEVLAADPEILTFSGVPLPWNA
jgi:cell wall assembly regulator SMI1